jgi:hypothetical protein
MDTTYPGCAFRDAMKGGDMGRLERLGQFEAPGATGIIFGTSGYGVERELRAYAEVAALR